MAVEAGRPNFLVRGYDYYRQVMAELRRVTWPDLAQVRQATIAIIIFVLLIGLVIWVMDVVLQGLLVKLIPSLFAR